MIESVFVIVLTMVFVAMVFSVLIWSYAHGVATSAADQGARAGSRIGVNSASSCEDRIHQALANLMPGVSAGAVVSCGESGGIVTSSVRVAVTGGVPPFDSRTISVGGSARKEVAPR